MVNAFAAEFLNNNRDHYSLFRQVIILPSPQEGVEVAALHRTVSVMFPKRKWVYAVDKDGAYESVQLGTHTLQVEKNSSGLVLQDAINLDWDLSFVKEFTLTDDEVASLAMYKSPRTLISRIPFTTPS